MLVITGSIDAWAAYRDRLSHPDRTVRIEHTGDLLPIETIGRAPNGKVDYKRLKAWAADTVTAG